MNRPNMGTSVICCEYRSAVYACRSRRCLSRPLDASKLLCQRVIAALMWGAALIMASPSAKAVTVQQSPAVREAHAAWLERNVERFDAASATLKSHVLAPYVQYWKLMLAPDDRSIRRFLDRHGDSFLAERLGRDWVRGLGRRGDWALISQVHAAIERPDADVSCWALRARLAQGEREAGDELLRGAWMQWRDLPRGCALAAGELAASGQLRPAAVWRRARNLVAMGEPTAARRTLALLPKSFGPARQQLDLALGAPERWLSHGRVATGIERELSAMAIARVAITDPMRAMALLRQHESRLDVASRAYVYAQLGLQAAKRLQDDALAWFALARMADLTDEHRTWWARAALRAQRWGDVRAAIEGMSTESRSEARWQYWLARASRALGDTPRAQSLWQQAAREHSFYGRLAQESLSTPALPPKSRPPTPSEIDHVARDAGIARAVALQRAGLVDDARGEWQWAVRKFDDRQLAAAAGYAQRLGAWNRSLDSAERLSERGDVALRYPTPFRELVRSAARQFGVEEAFVYGVMQQESRFSPNAASLVGARGLMQIMPGTAQWLASQLGWREFHGAWLDDPQRNIMLGTRYLRQLRGDLGGSEVLAAAGYNAGPGRAVAWLGPRDMEGAIYAETIPFDETREYVKRVMTASLHYAEQLHREPQQLAARLGQVKVRSGPVFPAAEAAIPAAGSAVRPAGVADARQR